ncbi:MAG: family 43 glycosylhydrolase [Treponema sp.]|jgi:hypothetical protein|nr:family 43 glycosylhydrolase [Treponema sp.]
MKNLFVNGLLLMAITLVLAGCSNGQNNAGNGETPVDDNTLVIFDGNAGGFITGAAARQSTNADGKIINLANFVTVTDKKITVAWNPDDGDNGAFRFIVDIDSSVQTNLSDYTRFKMNWTCGAATGAYFNISLYFNGNRMLSNWVGPGTGSFDFIDDLPGWAAGWGDAVVGTIRGFEIYAGADQVIGDGELVITKIWFEGDGGNDGDDDEIDLSQPGKSVTDANPLVTNVYCADPTAIEYEGRLYVYGTNDHQQYLYDKKGDNRYNRIKSLVMLSTDDMVNWTYHGTIDIGELSPWIIASWAPSIVSRVEADGKTHFYLYYSNSGFGVGVITATSPTGPWTSPLTKSLIDGDHPSVNHEWTPFDPGVVIDKDGVGWLAFGAGEPGTKYMPGGSHIVKLGSDMISLDSEVTRIPAPYHFEANELNYINDTYVYTYNTSWEPRTDWASGGIDAPAPSQCCMSYMTTRTPLDPDSWVYRGNYFKNPGDNGLEYSNNHTHLHKYNGQYYLFYHTLVLQKKYGVGGGFRSLFADIIEVNETTLEISEATPTIKGLDQIRNFDPNRVNLFATLAVSAGLAFEPYDEKGAMFVTSKTDGSWSMVRGVEFNAGAKTITAKVKGEGSIEVRLDSRDSAPVGHIAVSGSDWQDVTVALPESVSGKKNLFFVFDDGLSAYTWTVN